MSELTRNLTADEIQSKGRQSVSLESWAISTGSQRFRISKQVAESNSDLLPTLASADQDEHGKIIFAIADLSQAEKDLPVWVGNYDFWAAPVGRDKGGLQQDVFTALLD
jgi:hypothetical protein